MSQISQADMFDFGFTIPHSQKLRSILLVLIFGCLASIALAQEALEATVDTGVVANPDPVDPCASQLVAEEAAEVALPAFEFERVGGSEASVQDEGGAAAPRASSSQPDMGRALLALLLVLAAIIGAAYLLRRFKIGSGGLGGKSGIEILSRSVVNSKQSICLVKCGSRLLFVGISPNHMAVLDRIDDPDEISRLMGMVSSGAAGSISNTFAGLFRRESRQYEQAEEQADFAEPAESVIPETDDWGEAKAEVEGLLDKVKGIKKLSVRQRR
ncbi:MAG: FliO/MopB family protein [Sedimentisphaerales bacterium]|nr:FliO/MopB family protein [Sedimentisphaerales bacterium]